jgi:hypothetical protein
MNDHHDARFSAHEMPCLPAQRGATPRYVSCVSAGEGYNGTTLNAPAMYALHATLQKKHATHDYVVHQTEGTAWKSILESFCSLLHGVV